MTEPGAGTILIVEDNPTARKMFRVLLQSEGWGTLEAGDSAQAESAMKARPQLVLIDMVLLDMDGVALMRRLRKLPGGASAKMVALSGFRGLLAEARDARPDSGTGFDAFLEKPVEPERLLATVRALLPAAPRALQRRLGEHLLLVDDDPVQLKLERLRLLPWFAQVTTATTTAEALAAARAYHPDVVVSDVLMAGRDGFELCQALRADPALAAIPVVLVSAHYLQPADAELARRAGAGALVPRTPDLQPVIDAIQAALAAPPGPPQGAPARLADSPAEAAPAAVSPTIGGDHAERVKWQLEQQLLRNIELAQRCALQSAQLSILSGIANALTRSADLDTTLSEVLAACLDTGGITRGALYLLPGEPDNGALLRQQAGFGEPGLRRGVESLFGRVDLVDQVLVSGQPLAIPSPALGAAEGERILKAAGLRSALLVPLSGAGQPVGALLLGWSSDVSLQPEQLAFGRAIGAYIGQGLALTAAFAREQSARAAAETASRAKDEFLALIGHELRNPLAPILTAIQLMKTEGDAAFPQGREIIERQARHLIHLVDDLFDVARIARGHVELHKRRLELAEVVAKAVEITAPLYQQRHHALRAEVSPTLLVDGDEVRLTQVLTNLLTNAAHYSEPGGSVEIRGCAAGDEVLLSVRDQGQGISPELLPVIFDRFVQGPRSSARVEGGLGLGLTLVRNLVRLHGGSVSASSAGAGKGAEFVVHLPAAAPPIAVSHTTQTSSSPHVSPVLPNSPQATTPAAPAAAVTHPRRVLLVDDNEDITFLLEALVSSRGHEVAVAHDGPQAIEVARTFQPEVAVLDIGLPVMDGYELAARLRKDHGPRLARLIALTGYGQDHDRARSREAGFDCHLLKPIDSDVLLNEIAS